MKLQQLKYVVKVAEVGNITEASRRLFVSQPSITAAIRDLEHEMGVVIFERTNKGVVVTSEGETFLGYARQVLEQADLLEEKYKGETQQVPHFAVSCQHYSFAVNAFVDVIREFNAFRYDFTLREEQTHEIIEDVSRMKSELGIIYLSKRNHEVIEKMLRSQDLLFEPLFVLLQRGAAQHARPPQEHPRARPRDAVQPGRGAEWVHRVQRSHIARAQRREHHLRSAGRGRDHDHRDHHPQKHHVNALRESLPGSNQTPHPAKRVIATSKKARLQRNRNKQAGRRYE